MVLLKAFLEECARTGRDAEREFVEAVISEDDISTERVGATFFYRHVFSRFRSREAKRKMLYVMFMDPAFAEKRGMQQIFRKYRNIVDDFADYLDVYLKWHMSVWMTSDRTLGNQEEHPIGYDILCRFYENGEEERFPVDVCRIPEKLCVFVTDSEIKRMLEAFYPVRLENRVDGLSREILRRGSKELLKKAVRRGFISSVNASALLAEAGRLQCGNEIKVMLMKASRGESLAERYRQRKKVPCHVTKGGSLPCHGGGLL